MREENASEVMNRARQANQDHIFRFWDELSDTAKSKLLHQIKSIDFNLLKKLAIQVDLHKRGSHLSSKLEPAEILPIPRNKDDIARARKAKQVGEELLHAGKVAAVLVAGGQGSRLGFEGPKGKFIAGPISGKSLFQLHAEKIEALGLKYKKTIPWFIMTSETNDSETREFFQENNFFGLNETDVYFFVQGMIPALNEEGKLILDDKDHIFSNPNGHGGTLTSLCESGALAKMKKRGIEQIFYFQVDNVLIQICDPYFIGYHQIASADMSAKVVAKRDPYEKVGVVGKLDGNLTVIEYSDLPKVEKEAKTLDGKLKYNGGSIAIHMFKIDFIERLTSGELNLPYHVAHKKIPFMNELGEFVQPQAPNGYKFEMFIFDALPYARNPVIMEVQRLDEFSPIKNRTGDDSPATAKRDLVNYYGRMLHKAGVNVSFDENHDVRGTIEICSLFALDEHDLKRKLNTNLKFKDNLYLE